MSWAIGYDSDQKRDVGYGVPCICEHPDCDEEIHRGLSYVCGGEAFGGEHGCGLYFCDAHLFLSEDKKPQRCKRCCETKEPFDIKPDVPLWVWWKLNDESWAEWREEYPEKVKELLADFQKPLFIPLKSEYYEAFENGSKTDELRRYGKRWNEKTCKPGRLVVISKGYGKQNRKIGVIDKFENVYGPMFRIAERQSIIDVFGTLNINIARISIKDLVPVCG